MPWTALLVGGLVTGGAALTLSLAQLLKQVWTVRSVVRQLRRLSPARMKQALDLFEDLDVRTYLATLLHARGMTLQPGPTERFGFSAFDRRENKWFLWTAWGTTVLGVIAAIGLPDDSTRWRAVSIALAAASLAFVMLLEHRGRRLQRIFEISTFGLSEVQGDGGIRRVHWTEHLTLEDRRWHRRIEVARMGSDDDAIVIPYAIVGFDRAIELILERGGFTPKS
jgi:hypothetical protein